MKDDYGTHTKWHDPQPIGTPQLPSPIAVFIEPSTGRHDVCKLEGILNNVPIYRSIGAQARYEKREDAIRHAEYLLANAPKQPEQE